MSYQLSEYQNIGIGMYAALIEGILLQPTIYWKNARAWKLPFTLDLRTIYRGTAASLFNEMNMLGIQFGLTAFFQKCIATNKAGLSTYQQYSSATLGGMVSSIFTSPIELVMIQQQRKSGTVQNTLSNVVRRYGCGGGGLFRGLSPSIIRDSIYVVGLLGVTPVAHNYLVNKHQMSENKASIVSSVIGGIVASIPSHPFDVAKTCMAGDLKRLMYTTQLQTLQVLYREGGIQRLFHGGVWRTINIVGTVYIVHEIQMRLPVYWYGEKRTRSAAMAL